MAHSSRSLLALALPAVLAVSWLVPVGGVAQAVPADPYDAAHDAESNLDYRAVVTYSTQALKQPQNHEHMVELYRLLGTANAVLGHSDEAVDAFTRLLAIDPDHHMPRGLSPKITKPFKEAGGYWIDRPGGLGVTPNIPRDVAAGKPVPVSVKLDDPLQMTATVRFNYRREGDPDYMKMEQPAGGAISLAMAPGINFTIPGDQVPSRHADYNLEVYFTAIGPNGGELRSAGDAVHPLQITVRAVREEAVGTADTSGNALLASEPPPKKKSPAFLKKWWFWTAVGGVVVVGAALGGGLGWYYGRDTSHVDISVTSR
jgi:hypothetical protein